MAFSRLNPHACVHAPSGLTLCNPRNCRFLCLWNFPGKNTGMGGHFLLQGIFPTQGSNPSLLHLLPWQVDSLPLSHVENPLEGSKGCHKYTANPAILECEDDRGSLLFLGPSASRTCNKLSNFTGVFGWRFLDLAGRGLTWWSTASSSAMVMARHGTWTKLGIKSSVYQLVNLRYVGWGW